MQREAGGPPTAFVSYSHDSPEHVKRAVELAEALRTDGIDCQIDQYHMAPPEGWPAWMDRMIRESDFVIVLCTETYYQRVTGSLPRTGGLGARWEGAIIGQEIYEAAGNNTKFLPVVFRKEDLEFRPRYLRSTTYYDLSSEHGFEDLYRRLTSQPRVIAPALGNIRKLAPDAPTRAPAGDTTSSEEANSTAPPIATDTLLLISLPRGGLVIYEALEVRFRDQVELTLKAINAADASALRDLRSAHQARIGVAYGDTAFQGRVLEVEQQIDKGNEKWRVVLAPDAADYGAGIMEMGTSSHSADDFAEMRARRILLNERLEDTVFGARGELDRGFMEVLIRGHSSPIQVTESPLPALYQKLKSSPELYTAVARLVAILWLRLSGVVEHVLQLELALPKPGLLQVVFEGKRPRKYTNVEPHVISVQGDCVLE